MSSVTPKYELRHGPLTACWWSRHEFWFRVFGYGASVQHRHAQRVFSCRNGLGLHQHHVEIGSLLVCPLKP